MLMLCIIFSADPRSVIKFLLTIGLPANSDYELCFDDGDDDDDAISGFFLLSCAVLSSSLK